MKYIFMLTFAVTSLFLFQVHHRNTSKCSHTFSAWEDVPYSQRHPTKEWLLVPFKAHTCSLCGEVETCLDYSKAYIDKEEK